MILRALLSLPVLLLLAPSVGAHDAPSGWSYPRSCCSDRDCYPLFGPALEADADGYHIKATGEVIPFTSRRIKPSGDGLYHRCSWGGDVNASTICLFVPSGS
jgi:hypothetical protein